jgi:hypothetical protein
MASSVCARKYPKVYEVHTAEDFSLKKKPHKPTLQGK